MSRSTFCALGNLEHHKVQVSACQVPIRGTWSATRWCSGTSNPRKNFAGVKSILRQSVIAFAIELSSCRCSHSFSADVHTHFLRLPHVAFRTPCRCEAEPNVATGHHVQTSFFARMEETCFTFGTHVGQKRCSALHRNVTVKHASQFGCARFPHEMFG